MPKIEPLEMIELHLKTARGLADSVGETKLSYFIDMAILEAAARLIPLPQVLLYVVVWLGWRRDFDWRPAFVRPCGGCLV